MIKNLLDAANKIKFKYITEDITTKCWKSSIRSMRVNGKLVSVVRIMLDVYKPGELPEYNRPEIGRTCGNSSCVNPSHLFYKTAFHRFWEKVNKSGDGGCWEWNGAVDGGGYGSFIVSQFPPIREKAHRYSWIMSFGDIPEGMLVCHHCDKPSCVNPEHLFLGSNLDNIRDKMSKNRCSRMNGDSNGRCKLSENDVREIVSLHDSGVSYRNISNRYGIGNTQVARIIRKESWRWIWD